MLGPTILILDTNQWVYLANSQDPTTSHFQEGHHFKLFATLTQMIAEGKVILMRNQIVEQEWKRNRGAAENLIRTLKSRKDTAIKQLKAFKKQLDGTCDAELEKVCLELGDKYDDDIRRNEQHIAQVEGLLQSCREFPISEKVLARVATWSMEKKAPFIGDKKNSTADAAMLFAAVEEVKNEGVEYPYGEHVYPDSIFVTGNKDDFASKNNDDEIHSDLKPLLDSVGMAYFKSLPKALNHVSKVFEEEEVRRMEQEMDLLYSDGFICNECSPNSENEGCNVVHLGAPEDVFEESYDPSQLELDLPGLSSSSERVKRVKFGYCIWCSATHIECECGEILSEDYSVDDQSFECSECGTTYINEGGEWRFTHGHPGRALNMDE